MTQQEYDKLPFSTKGAFLFESPENYLCSIDYYNQTVALYKLHNFYVEVYYDKQTNDIIEIKSCSEKDLNKFVSRVKIEF